jgi:hypothetical protein
MPSVTVGCAIMKSTPHRWDHGAGPGALVAWLVVLAMSTASRLPAAVPEDGGVTIEELTEEVRANEDLYRDIEFRMHVRYKLSPDVPRGPIHLNSFDRRAWVVYQGDRLFFQDEDEQRRVDGQSKLIDTIQGYDGQITRQVEQRDIANIHDGRYEDPRLLRPHTLILGLGTNVIFPLSTLMRGSEAIQASAGSQLFKGVEVRSQVLGREVVDGLDCYKVAIDLVHRKPDKTTWLLWLARDRNLLPLKLESLPALAARVEKLREIGPGVWLPSRASMTYFNPALSRKAGQPVVDNETHYELVEARLHPNYPDRFFRDIPIPDGMTVYELRGGKIVRSYIQGGGVGARGGRLGWWLVPLGLVGLGGGTLATLRHRQRARSRG